MVVVQAAAETTHAEGGEEGEHMQWRVGGFLGSPRRGRPCGMGGPAGG